MTTRHARKTELDDAVAALQPFYDAGDDGYPVTLALDALAGILGETADLDVEAERGLVPLLETLSAPEDLRDDVQKLYENAEGGEYGMGLSQKQAKMVNDLVQEIVDPLVELLSGFGKPKTKRSRSRKPRTKK
jgi:hypothetical protein